MRFVYRLVIGIYVLVAASLFAQDKAESTGFDLSKQIKLYPNPAVEYLTIKFEAPQARQATIVVHNIIGSEIEVETEVVDDFEVKIKVRDLSTGFYVVIVRNGQTGLKGAYKFLKK